MFGDSLSIRQEALGQSYTQRYPGLINSVIKSSFFKEVKTTTHQQIAGGSSTLYSLVMMKQVD
jgi:hypothetical protein